MKVKINTPFIKLEQLLKFSGICDSGGQAKILIQDGMVAVNGEICDKRGKKIVVGDKVNVNGEVLEVL